MNRVESNPSKTSHWTSWEIWLLAYTHSPHTKANTLYNPHLTTPIFVWLNNFFTLTITFYVTLLHNSLFFNKSFVSIFNDKYLITTWFIVKKNSLNNIPPNPWRTNWKSFKIMILIYSILTFHALYIFHKSLMSLMD